MFALEILTNEHGGFIMSIQMNSRAAITSRRRGCRDKTTFARPGVCSAWFLHSTELWGRRAGYVGRWNMRRRKMNRNELFNVRVNAVDRQMLDALAGAIGRSRGATLRLLVRRGAAELAAAAVARRAAQQHGGGRDDN